MRSLIGFCQASNPNPASQCYLVDQFPDHTGPVSGMRVEVSVLRVLLDDELESDVLGKLIQKINQKSFEPGFPVLRVQPHHVGDVVSLKTEPILHVGDLLLLGSACVSIRYSRPLCVYTFHP